MLNFITTTSKAYKCNNISFDSIEAKRLVHKVFDNARKGNKHIGFDYEAQGLDPIKVKPLILGIATGDDDFVAIECWNNNPFNLFPEDWNDFYFIAHNAKYDCSLTHFTYGIVMNNLFDTMIASQKISQNLPFRHNYGAVVKRYLNIDLNKDYGKSFVNHNPDNVPFYSFEQIDYLREDVIYMNRLRDAMVKVTTEYKLTRWLYGVEFRLIPILAVSENTGVGVDLDGLKKIEKDNKAIIFDLSVQLDEELKRLTQTLPKERRQLLIGGKFTKQRNDYHAGSNQITIFGDVIKDKVVSQRARKNVYKDVKVNTANINWKSDKEFIDIFARLGESLMTKSGDYVIPILDENGKVYPDRGLTEDGLLIKIEGFRTNKRAFAQYFIDKPECKANKLISMFLQYNKVCHETSAFATGLINKVYKETNNLHTIYKQSATANSRFSSGGGKDMPMRFQSQNIPRDVKFRHCIRAPYPNWKVATCDLSGAEVTIICDKANDTKLYEWAVKNDDAHSPIVQNSWRHIFLYRAGWEVGMWQNASDFKYKFEYGTIEDVATSLLTVKNKKANYYANLALNFIVSRTVNKPYRQGGKNNTFGSIYNMGAKTAADTYNGTTSELKKADPNAKPVNVSIEDAKVGLYAIKKAIPVTFDYVESVARDAICRGYLILNTRSNSRVWFNEVLKVLQAVKITAKENKKHYNIKSHLEKVDTRNGIYYMNTGEEFKMEWKFLVDVDGQARNLTISGTQADMIKESMVVIDKFIKKANYPAIFMLQVHDELVYGYDRTAGDISYNIGYDKTASFPEFLKDVMSYVSTMYLENFDMKAEVDDEDYWTK